MTEEIRFFLMLWGHGVDDAEAFALPSLLQPGNIPWLLDNGHRVQLSLYTTDRDAARVRAIGERIIAEHGAEGRQLVVAVSIAPGTLPDGAPTPADALKKLFFTNELATVAGASARLILVGAEGYFGNGSIRHIVTYGRAPRTVVTGPYLRVKREAFIERLRSHRERSGSAVISNAQLVDIAIGAPIDALANSFVDRDVNSSYFTGCSLRQVGDDLFTMVQHLPSPILLTLERSDLDFLRSGFFESLDHAWPALLLAQRRMRVIASSDLFFCAEVNSVEVEREAHSYPMRAQSRYNDDFYLDTLHGQACGIVVTTLRRAPIGVAPQPVG